VRYEERGQGYRDVEKVGKHYAGLLPRVSYEANPYAVGCKSTIGTGLFPISPVFPPLIPLNWAGIVQSL